ncbi:MAG TPA: hypothetical protein VGN57_19845 [Pirellulaceae bacterium]|nr:hypothetical protein [Pirellulaceae bacterium]
MSQENPSPFAAYAPPAAGSAATPVSPYQAYLPILKQFREQMLALGVLWLLFGALGSVAGAALVAMHLGQFDVDAERLEGFPLFLALFALAIGLLWLFAGVGTLMKRQGAVIAGLVLSYLWLVGNVISLNLCLAALAIVVIIQAHRVLRFASQLRAAGVPLDTKP